MNSTSKSLAVSGGLLGPVRMRGAARASQVVWFMAATCLAVMIAARFGVQTWVVRTAVNIPSNAQGLGGLVNAIHKLVTPLLVAGAALALPACIGGAIATIVGARSGPKIILVALAMLVFLGSVTGIVQ